mmetsp:Transcript_52336/g.61107  ORF Transcript_52336/g.61107 Transcript_52336/m.61107 type:complete len:165 (-) Transcript_52336:454-948(-)
MLNAGLYFTKTCHGCGFKPNNKLVARSSNHTHAPTNEPIVSDKITPLPMTTDPSVSFTPTATPTTSATYSKSTSTLNPTHFTTDAHSSSPTNARSPLSKTTQTPGNITSTASVTTTSSPSVLQLVLTSKLTVIFPPVPSNSIDPPRSTRVLPLLLPCCPLANFS